MDTVNLVEDIVRGQLIELVCLNEYSQRLSTDALLNRLYKPEP